MRTVAPHAFRRLVLWARRAAFSFTAARRAGDRATSCRPIALRWRRIRARADAPRIGRHQPPAPVAWHPHFHLHFAGVAMPQRRGPDAPMPGAALVRERQRVVSERRDSISRFTHLATREWRRETCVTARASMALAAASIRSWREASPRRPSAATLADRAPFRHVSRYQNTDAIAPSAPARHAGQMLSKAAAAPNPCGKHQPVGSPPRLFRRAAGRQTREADPVPVQPRRPILLVWRSAAAASSRPLSTPDRTQPIPITASSSPSRPARAASAPAAEQTTARVLVRTSDFEPGVLDCLADDVIRRVERRVRIERERRGL